MTFRRVCMKYIDAAVERLKTKRSVVESDLSLLERILAAEADPNTAYIFALDLILVGIDTVSSHLLRAPASGFLNWEIIRCFGGIHCFHL